MPDFMRESSIVRQAIARTMIWDAITLMRHLDKAPHPGDDALSSPRSESSTSSPVQGTRKVPVYTKAAPPPPAEKIAQPVERGRAHQQGFVLGNFGLKFARILPPMEYACSKQNANARREASAMMSPLKNAARLVRNERSSLTGPPCPQTRFRSVNPYNTPPESSEDASTASWWTIKESEEKKSDIDIVDLDVKPGTSLILPWRREISINEPASIHFPIPESDSRVNYVVEILLGEDEVVDIEVENNDEEHEPVSVDIESFGAELRYI